MGKKDIILTTTIVILCLSYLTLLIGVSIVDSRPYFLPYIPILYAITFFTLLYFHKGWSPNFLLYLIITIVGCYLVQLANVKTPFVYGQITYGNVLGPKVLGVPVLATLNRFTLIYCVGLLVKRLKIKIPVISSLLGALILTLISLLAEPIATLLKFRVWSSHMSPLHNYGVRFIASFVFLYLFNRMSFSKRNNIYLAIFLMEIAFYLCLNLFVI